MTNGSTVESIHEQYTHRVGEDWDQGSENKKVNLVNNVYRKNERRLETAREKMAKLDDPTVSDDAWLGQLYKMAYQDMQQVVYEARVQGKDVEPFEERLKQFERTADPVELARLSEKALKLRRRPAEMHQLLDEETERRVRMLVNSTYSGTEVVKEGSSGESSDNESPV